MNSPSIVFRNQPDLSATIPSGTPQKIACRRRDCIPHLVSIAAEETPDAIALIQPVEGRANRQVTYAELESNASKLAAHLQSLGVGPESVVALCLDRSIDYVTASLAIGLAGGACLPLDPAWPEEKRNLIVEDAKARILITRYPYAGRARFVVDLERDYSTIVCGVMPLAPVILSRKNLAYLLCSFNDGGEFKGVELTHGNLLNMAFWLRREFSVTSNARGVFLSGAGAAGTLLELWPFLSAGAAVTIAPESVRTSSDALRDWLCLQQATVACIPAPLAALMISSPWPEDTRLRSLITTGEPLYGNPIPNLPFRVVSTYGPIECTSVAACVEVGPEDLIGSLGKAAANSNIYVLNQFGHPVQPGETGEVYVSGPGVARGYRNGGPSATRFREDPLNPGLQMYRTGDCASMGLDGFLFFHGRTDSKERIQGVLVEPVEVTRALASHPSIAACTVVARPVTEREKQLVAYVVGKPGVEISVSALRVHLGESLPAEMIPVAYVRVDRLPLDSNGKLDLSALPSSASHGSPSLVDYSAPESPVELGVAEILRGMFDLRRISLTDNFCFLGGNSTHAGELARDIEERFQIKLNPRHILAARTIGDIARMVTEALAEKKAGLTDEEVSRALARVRRP